MTALILHSGTPFAAADTCKHPGRLAQLVGFLHWLSPLAALTREEQMRLGALATHARLAAVDDEDPDEDAGDAPDGPLPEGTEVASVELPEPISGGFR